MRRFFRISLRVSAGGCHPICIRGNICIILMKKKKRFFNILRFRTCEQVFWTFVKNNKKVGGV